MLKNGEGYSDPTFDQALWGIREEEKTRALEKKYGVHRGETYKVLVERTSDDATTCKVKREYRKMKVVGVYPHIITLEDKNGIKESFQWHEFYKRRKE